ncbi:hypothetical protein B484DRAFT_134736 [Ochromonadaceae sp. CCMP2298]|nr:hypothetical protein B484DRAFT_134736 [Ochromonadaceae sp. CCMP2298]
MKLQDCTNDEMKAFIAVNSEYQLRSQINQVMCHGGCFFPMVQMLQILFEKGGWDRKSWTKELDSGRKKVGASFLDAAIYSEGGFYVAEQLSIEFLILAGASVTEKHRSECASNHYAGGETYNQEPHEYIFDHCSVSAAKRSTAFLNGAVDFEQPHALPSEHAKMQYVHDLFTSTCCTAWDETDLRGWASASSH